MALTAGDDAPDFTLYDDQKEPFTLSDQTDTTVLLFFPGAFTSVCTTEMNTVGNDYQRYQDLGAQVVGISTDSPFVLDEFRQANGFPFRLLSDHSGEVAATYGAKYDHDFTPMKLDRIARRAAFVVQPDGTLSHVEVLENAGEQPDFDAIVAALDGSA